MIARPVLAPSGDPKDRLALLGLTREHLREAIVAGEIHRRRCTRNHPPSYAGYGAWAETVCRLGEALRPDGWKRRDPSNFSIVVNPEESVAVAVATGDDRTGREGLPEPRTKYDKGPTWADAVERNLFQLELFDTGRRTRKSVLPALTWILLMVRAKGEIRYELSLPHKVDEDGYIVSWRDRIILEPLVIEETTQREPLEPTDAIDIDVPPRED